MRISLIAVIGLCVAICSSPSDVWSQTRDEQVRNDRQNLVQDENWIYDDLDAALAKAQVDGKPLMAVLRCIP